MELKNTKTLENLKAAFAGESQANRRYIYFSKKADVEGFADVSSSFQRIADGETSHAFGHFDMLLKFGAGDPVTDLPVGNTADNLRSAIAGEEYESPVRKALKRLPNGLRLWQNLKKLMQIPSKRSLAVLMISKGCMYTKIIWTRISFLLVPFFLSSR